jgi:hypothetical protein
MDDAVRSPLRGDRVGQQRCPKKENQQEQLGFDQRSHLENIPNMAAASRPTWVIRVDFAPSLVFWLAAHQGLIADIAASRRCATDRRPPLSGCPRDGIEDHPKARFLQSPRTFEELHRGITFRS